MLFILHIHLLQRMVLNFYVSDKANMVSVTFDNSGNVVKHSTYSGNSSDVSGYILSSGYGSSVQFMTSHNICDFSGNMVFQNFTSNTYDNNETSGSILITAGVESTYAISLPATLALS